MEFGSIKARKMSNISDDEIEACLKIEPHELDEVVKSKAVVKFAAVESPSKYYRLECNTDLNLPPTNWLTTSDNSHGIHQAVYHTPAFTSFRMAHLFPDCIGEVDVVSDAENIKSLLKIPYASKGVISMIVHKAGNTLLIDEFDIQKYLLRRADDNWKWLRSFILEQIFSCGNKEQNICLKDKSRKAIQHKNLLSKFLYHSLMDDEEFPDREKSKQPSLPITGPVLPQPKIDENVPDPKSSHDFNRNVVWTFEDIRMLIGTDMPIFGGPTRPCISLRLRDMAKPINVLTGIDYWLDNLMCNVPEVVMCYHIDGIVQKYEIIKTEDLPYLEDSKFSPQVVRTVAQNILSFLKSNATKEGHTYWLFKGRNDDVVKLYDLTTLCEDQTDAENDSTPQSDKVTNPFTVPVAMLLYTVAKNMKSSTQRMTSKTGGNIRALLENCIKLLPKEKFPQIVTSSHYILSDLHIPLGTDPKYPNFDTTDEDSDSTSMFGEEEEEDDDDGGGSSGDGDGGDSGLTAMDHFQEGVTKVDSKITAKELSDALKEFKIDLNENTTFEPKSSKKRPAPLVLGAEERCKIALQHISDGLNCLRFYNTNEEKFLQESEARAKEEERQKIIHEEQNPNMAKPFKPIPLPYVRLNSNVDNSKEKVEKLRMFHSELFLFTDITDPMNYANQAKRVKTAEELQQDREHIKEQVTSIFNSQQFGSWNVHLKLLLFEKACLVYATLAEIKYNMQMYGACLKLIYIAYKCQAAVMKYITNITSQKSCLFGRAADCLFQMGKFWLSIDDFMNQYEEFNEVDDNIMAEISKELKDDDCPEIILPERDEVFLLFSSSKLYSLALRATEEGPDFDDHRKELLRRLGNAYNELGVRYMYWSQAEYAKLWKVIGDADPEEVIFKLKMEDKLQYDQFAKDSYDFLRCGIMVFEGAEDYQNLALLYCNLGRFHRFRAHLIMPFEKISAVSKLKCFYKDAFSYYEKAKEVLKSRKRNPDLWDKVNWELSTATFNYAKQLQDLGENCKTCDGDAKEVLDILQKALKLCDVDHQGSRQVLYSFRAALLHRRIASFHHSQLRRQISQGSPLSKATMQLSKSHYDKAAAIFDSLKESYDLLMVQLEKMWLMEYLSEFTKSNAQKIKNLQEALKIGLETISCYEYALQNKTFDSELMAASSNNDLPTTPLIPPSSSSPTPSTSAAAAAAAAVSTLSSASASSSSSSPSVPIQGEKSDTSGSNIDEFIKYSTLLENRIQFALKNLIKLLLIIKDPKKQTVIYRKMYLETLTGKHATGGQQPTDLKLVVENMYNLLQRLNELEKEISD